MQAGRVFSSITSSRAATSVSGRQRGFDLRLIVVRYRVWLALTPLALMAFALRAHGADFGLPHLYYWDEPTIVNRAVRFGSGDLNPHFFVYPALYMYAIFGLGGAYFLLGFVLGDFASPTDFATQYFVDPSDIYLSARLMTAVIGSASVVLVYFVGRKYFSELVGYLGAVFLAVSILHTSHSHIAIADVPQSMLIVAAYLPLHDVATKGRRRDYVLAGALIGLGIAMKYVAALLLPTLIAAHLMRRWRADPDAKKAGNSGLLSPNLMLAGCCVIGAFFVGSPYNFLDFGAFWADLRDQSAISAGEGGNSLAFFAFDVLPADLGWPLYLTALAGLLLIAARHRRTDVLFLIFPLVYFLFFARYDRVFARYMIQEDPFLALMAAYAVAFLFARLREHQVRLAPALIACLAAGLIALPASVNVRWNAMMASGVDTRTEAYNWANVAVPDGTKVAIQPLFGRTYYNAPLQTDRSLAELNADIPGGSRFDAVRADVFRRLNASPTFTEVVFSYDLQALRNQGVRYIFISDQNWSKQTADFLANGGTFVTSDPLTDEQRFAIDLMREAVLLQVFEPEKVPGMSTTVLPIQPPTISVYELR